MNSRANGGISAGDGKNVQNNPPRWQGVQSSHAGVSVQTGLPSRAYEETYTCICCPLGCQLTVMLQQGPAGLDVTGVVGYTCRRGKDYARQEATHPVRMVTAAVATSCSKMLPARVLPWWLPRPYNKERNRNHRAAKRPLLWRIGFLRAGAPAFLCVRERGHFMHVFACFNRVHAHHFASSRPIHKLCSLVFGRFMHKTKKFDYFVNWGCN